MSPINIEIGGAIKLKLGPDMEHVEKHTTIGTINFWYSGDQKPALGISDENGNQIHSGIIDPSNPTRVIIVTKFVPHIEKGKPGDLLNIYADIKFER